MNAPAQDAPDQGLAIFSLFLQLEEAARNAPTLEALRFSMVNELRRLVEYRLAAVVGGNAFAGPVRVEAVSGVAVLDRDTPMLHWLDRVVARVAGHSEAGTVHTVNPLTLPDRERGEWAEWCPPQVLWCPLATGEGRTLGALWLARDRPWEPAEVMMVTKLAGCYAHAWMALTGGRTQRRPLPLSRLAVAGTVLALLGMAVPVPQSALAPVEIVPAEPVVVAAPIDGVIARFRVSPNQTVTAGQALLEFDDTTLKNQATVAERTLDIARAELRQAAQGAMLDRKHGEQVALLEAQTQLRSAELDYARSLLARVTVTAERAGIAVFADANDWVGRPVVTGQRILQIADPARVEARIALPVHDSVVLEQGASVELFLDNNPLAPLPARLTSASYESEMTPAGVISYRLTASFPATLAPPRIGLQGIARVSGSPVPLVLYLFRRPLTALRQWLGY